MVPQTTGLATGHEPAIEQQTSGMDLSTIFERSRAEPARRFQAVADPARLAILSELRSQTRCVCELQETLGMAPNLLSYHMRILREAGLVSGSRQGRRVEYKIEASGFRALRRELERLAPDADADDG
ncbi:MAG: metalloregulator ArsR/SmtB family transcription factor [Actinomycetota bacterium]